ncbi:MAG: NADH-quinone oxidoreductase subunit N [Blastocatellia bacterium]|nr:NADH-quinone oxidoreductase subunit N [Blastocatellia bacterium]
MPYQAPLPREYYALMPEIAVSITGIVIMMYDAFAPKGSRRGAGYIALAGLVAAGVSVAYLWNESIPPAFSGMLLTDKLRLFFDAIFILVAGVSVLMAMQPLDDERLPAGEYFTLLMFATVGMLLMGGAGDLAMLFLGLETLSITTYVMAGYRRGDLRCNESALKYFILGSFSTGFLLYGIALTYGATKSTNFLKIQQAIASGQITYEPLLTIGVAMILIGLCFKVATAPFHVWTPDVYEGAPTMVTGFMAAGPKAAAFAIFARVFVQVFSPDVPNAANLAATWTDAVALIAVLSMIVGNVIAIQQTNIKRMLAYSSIAHAGYALVGVLARDWQSVAFYMLTYAVMNLGAFTIVTILARQGDEKTELDDYAGIGFHSMGLSVVLMIFMLSLGGIPLTAGFMGKLVIFKQGWQAGFHEVVIIGVLNSAVSLYYYLRPLVVMFFKERETPYVPPKVTAPFYAALAISVIAVFYLGMFPNRTLNALEMNNASKDAKAPAAALPAGGVR